MKILLIGGTGTVGATVVTDLLARGADLRLLVRAADTAVPLGVEKAVGELLDPPSIERALAGIEKMYLLNAVTPDELTQGLIAYDLARRLGVKHIVYRSVFRADVFGDVPHFAAKSAIEAALKAFDVPWTIIRPNYFFQNDATFRELLTGAGIYPSPLGDVGISAVDVRDIAEAAAISLTTAGHEGKTYNLNGPELLSGTGAAAIWSKVLDRPIAYGGHDMNAFEANMRQRGPSWSAFDFAMMFRGYLERGFSAEPGDIETLTALLGHQPRAYEAFVRETASSWVAAVA
jgi:uncharacterized protein YbjT (DUF2867 family)